MHMACLVFMFSLIAFIHFSTLIVESICCWIIHSKIFYFYSYPKWECFISFLDNFLLVYVNATNVHILILYPTTSSNSFISSSSFGVVFGVFCMCELSYANGDKLNFFFQNCRHSQESEAGG